MKLLVGAMVGALFAAAQVPSPVALSLRDSVSRVVNHEGSASAYYVAGGYARTAAHVARYAPNFVGNDLAKVSCLDVETDSALLVASGPTLQEDRSPLSMRERVIVAGWPRGQYAEFHGTVHGYMVSMPVIGLNAVGPLVFVRVHELDPLPLGISGGPVVRAGKAVATVVAYGSGLFAAVPIGDSGCKLPVNVGER